MNEAEGVNFKVGPMGDQSGGGKSKRISTGSSGSIRQDNPTLEDMLLFVKKLNISDEEKDILEKKLKKIPHGSLGNFKMNYMSQLKRKR